MNKIQKIFNKIKIYFMQLFNKKDIKLIEESSQALDDFQPRKNDYTENNHEKNDFFIIYNNLKKGIIKPEELMIHDLIKVQLMMQSELDYVNDKIHISEDEINELNNNIFYFRQNNDMYKEKLKNIN